jgi:hypothetical protein
VNHHAGSFSQSTETTTTLFRGEILLLSQREVRLTILSKLPQHSQEARELQFGVKALTHRSWLDTHWSANAESKFRYELTH